MVSKAHQACAHFMEVAMELVYHFLGQLLAHLYHFSCCFMYKHQKLRGTIQYQLRFLNFPSNKLLSPDFS